MARLFGISSFAFIFLKSLYTFIAVYEQNTGENFQYGSFVVPLILFLVIFSQSISILGIVNLEKKDNFLKFSSFFYMLWISALNFYIIITNLNEILGNANYLLTFTSIVGVIQIPMGVALVRNKVLIGNRTVITGILFIISGIFMASVVLSSPGQLLLIPAFYLLGMGFFRQPA